MKDTKVVLDLIKHEGIRKFTAKCLSTVDPTWAASCGKHHCYSGGLIEHLCDTGLTAMRIASGYQDKVNIDVCISAALLHDIGKQESYTQGQCYPHKCEGDKSPWVYTDMGTYFGHISVGFHKAWTIATEMNMDYEPDIRNILHCILAHHGRKEWGSPVEPLTREAHIVHLADYADAWINSDTLKKGF